MIILVIGTFIIGWLIGEVIVNYFGGYSSREVRKIIKKAKNEKEIINENYARKDDSEVIRQKKRVQNEVEYDKKGFNSRGLHKNGTIYNDEGYKKDGFNRYGNNKKGNDRYGNKKEDSTEFKQKSSIQSNLFSKNSTDLSNSMSFDECLKKHFPLGYNTLATVANITGSTVEKDTLTVLLNYKGDTELSDEYLGALICHVRQGSINKFDLDDLLRKLSWSSDFEFDVKNSLIVKNNQSYNRESKQEVKRDIPKINTNFNTLKLANSGDTASQIQMGDNYLNGLNGFDENDDEAFKWYKKAADKNHPIALGKLGEMYQYGFGVSSDRTIAKKLYKQGVDLNDANSQFRYGWLVEKEGNKTLAYKYYTLAANQGHSTAEDYVIMLQMGL